MTDLRKVEEDIRRLCGEDQDLAAEAMRIWKSEKFPGFSPEESVELAREQRGRPSPERNKKMTGR